MRITTLLIAPIALCTLLAAACSGAASSRPASTPEPRATWPVQTGIEPVDRFLNLLAADDLQAITDDIVFETIECEPDRLVQDASLYCYSLPEGVTSVEGIIVGIGCFPFWHIAEDEFPESIQWLADDDMELAKVHRTDSGYALTLIEHSDPPAPAVSRSVVYLTDDGHLDSYAFCGEFTEPYGVVAQLWP
jgi:hypothetical protein